MNPWTDLVGVHWASRSEAYVTPVGPELVGVAVLSSVQAPYDQQLAAFPLLRDRLPDTGVTPVLGAARCGSGHRLWTLRLRRTMTGSPYVTQ